ncbi:RNA-directed DNA polymerase, eukaryota, reverse transcriptase zinc-binding domain protein [Tanacetum coccineum]
MLFCVLQDDNYLYSSVWANSKDVREAIHIRAEFGDTEWVRCNENLHFHFDQEAISYTHNVMSVVGYHRNLSDKNCRALIYSGDHDMVIPYLSTVNWIESLNLPVIDNWRPWVVNKQVAGYTIKYSKDDYDLTFASVKGGGHTVQGTWTHSNEVIFMINIYEPHDPTAKASLWNRILDFIQHHNGKFILCGDFNEVRLDSERYGSVFSRSEAQVFNSFIDAAGLVEIPMGGRQYTWMTSSLQLMQERDDLEMYSTMDMAQKARIRWDLEGDENTKFFHGILKMKRRSQMVQGILINGEWYTNPMQVKDAFFNFYKDKFQAQEPHFDATRNVGFTFLHPDVADSLQQIATNEEIKHAVWACGSDKAPDRTDSHSLPRGTNSAFITLIPKVINPILITDYRPISLIGMQYKIIAKLLANRLARVLDNIVSPVQSAFISGRQILDGPLMVSEIIDWYKKKNKKLMIFKVDFEKAFVSVNWSYLDYVLLHMGFGNKWRFWIRSCLFSARTSILVNGSPTLEFSLGRGLRQGDPLSPFLFILVMEGLHLAFQEATQMHLIKGDSLQSMAHLAGCLAGTFPFSYLGLPIGKSMKYKDSWNLMVDKFKAAKLSKWKVNLLSIDGRLMLTKSVLDSFRGDKDHSNMAWVKWDTILASLDQGGLGVGSLKAFNLALLQKWRWRLITNPDSLWVKVVKAIHGVEAGFDEKGCYTNGTWVNIVGSTNYLHSRNIIPKAKDGQQPAAWILERGIEELVMAL